MSDRLGLVDYAIWQVSFLHNLPDGQLKYSKGGLQLQMNSKANHNFFFFFFLGGGGGGGRGWGG